MQELHQAGFAESGLAAVSIARSGLTWMTHMKAGSRGVWKPADPQNMSSPGLEDDEASPVIRRMHQHRPP